ncbi:hypothetical protein [Pseudoxanthomonas mexicana]|uniref:hypothetical protein n=1 Tax=Pseudoxanthomonas mexicana TaxID=128785 RepID=UPI00398B3F40
MLELRHTENEAMQHNPRPQPGPGEIPHPAYDPTPDQPIDPVPDRPIDPMPDRPRDPVELPGDTPGEPERRTP